jgi:hypothetical protein
MLSRPGQLCCQAHGKGASSELVAEKFRAEGQHGNGGGVYIDGMNDENPGGDLLVCGAVFRGNTAMTHGSGMFFNGAATLHLVHCTFSGNHADYGPAIFKGQSVTFTVENTIFASSTTDNRHSARSCHEAMTNLGGNMQWPDRKRSGNPDQPCVEGIPFADPKLQPSGDDGGVSEMFALGPHSPAIDFASDCAETDPRGLPRSEPRDTGAFEVQP